MPTCSSARSFDKPMSRTVIRRRFPRKTETPLWSVPKPPPDGAQLERKTRPTTVSHWPTEGSTVYYSVVGRSVMCGDSATCTDFPLIRGAVTVRDSHRAKRSNCAENVVENVGHVREVKWWAVNKLTGSKTKERTNIDARERERGDSKKM